jgi:hypothetical protein
MLNKKYKSIKIENPVEFRIVDGSRGKKQTSVLLGISMLF